MIAKQPFGRTGHISTRTLFGAAALGSVSQADADRTLDVLLKYGINHIDTAASYGDAELRIGPWMDHHRKEFFLATKTGQRTYREAKEEFHRSLERLHVDSVDLIQIHALIKPDEWEVALGPGGVLEALVEARQQGLTRFIGITGHELSIAASHKRALERFDFDSVLLPYNFTLAQNPQYSADFEALVSLCQQRNTAVQTIKSLSNGPWGGKDHVRSTWYQPLEDQTAIDHAVHWVLGRPGIFLNTTGDINILPRVLDAASRFQSRPSDEQMKADIEKYHIAPLFV